MPTTPGTFGGFVFDPEVFTGYIAERDPVNSLLISSGVVIPAPVEVSASITNKNNVVTIPFYVPFEGDALNYDGKTDNVPATLSGKSMTGMAYRRMKAWTEGDFTHELTGANDLSNVAGNIGAYQAKQNQKTLLSIFKGLEGVTAFATHINDIARADVGTVATANRLGADNGIVAMQNALGDHMSEFQTWFMHSAVYTDLVRQGLANDVTIKAGAITADPYSRSFLGMPVIIDDTMTFETDAVSGLVNYHTYLCGSGLIMTAPARIDMPNEVLRDPKTNGGETSLFSKWGRLLHPYGFSLITANITEQSPTNAELANPANWTLKYDLKNIPLVAFISNVA